MLSKTNNFIKTFEENWYVIHSLNDKMSFLGHTFKRKETNLYLPLYTSYQFNLKNFICIQNELTV